MILDLSDQSSIRDFARRFGDRALNVLINNAAVMACPFERTKDGLEMQIGTNHFGHFLLTYLLMKNLIKGAKESNRSSRVVSLSSIGHRLSPVVFDDIHFKSREYNKWKSYGQSKTANSLLAIILDKKFKDQGIRAFAVHPGGIMTGLQKHIEKEEMIAMGWMDDKGNLAKGFKTPQQGASTTCYAAVHPDLEGRGGFYLEDCHEAKLFTPEIPPMTGVRDYAIDEENAEKLWKISLETFGLTEKTGNL